MMVIIDHMDRLQSLEVFIAVAEAESFAEGARRMGLSAPSATRGVNALEGRLGVRLFTRTTRRVRLTEVGQSYLEDARHIVAQMQAADDDASGSAANPVGTLRLTCSNEFGRIYVTPILTDFLDTYPDVTADVVMVDRVVNMVEEGFDVAVRIGALPPVGPDGGPGRQHPPHRLRCTELFRPLRQTRNPVRSCPASDRLGLPCQPDIGMALWP